MRPSTTKCGSDVELAAPTPDVRASGHTHGRAAGAATGRPGGGGCHERAVAIPTPPLCIAQVAIHADKYIEQLSSTTLFQRSRERA